MSRNCESIDKSNSKTRNSIFETRLTNIHTPENISIQNLLIDIHLQTLNICEMNIRIKVTYIFNIVHKNGFILLADIFIY